MQASRDASGREEGFEVFLKYLPPHTRGEGLSKFFSSAGQIVGEPRLMLHPSSGACKGVGWITFASQQGAEAALAYDGACFEGRRIQVSVATKQHTGFRPSLQPAGTHTPALLSQVIAKLASPNKGGVLVDATFGRGGHSRGLLGALSPSGSLHAFDMDPDAVSAAGALAASDKRFTIHHLAFSRMGEVLQGKGVSSVFFDLGISSPQFDEAHRGFRLEADGPLDLRFDQSGGVPAWEWLSSAPRGEVIRVIREFGETSDPIAARRIADAICLARDQKGEPPSQLLPIVSSHPKSSVPILIPTSELLIIRSHHHPSSPRRHPQSKQSPPPTLTSSPITPKHSMPSFASHQPSK